MGQVEKKKKKKKNFRWLYLPVVWDGDDDQQV